MAEISNIKPNENFWDIDGYKSVIKRTENGRKMCEFLLKMVEERAQIEKSYSEKLSSWYKKWTHAVEKSPEYGTNKEMLRNFVLEGDKLSDVHVKIKDSLLNLVNSKIRNWKDEHYRKQICSCKPASTFKSEFEKAQKPWAAQVKRVDKLKKEYFKYCQESNEALTQEENAQNSEIEHEKVKARCEKATTAMDLMKTRYQEALEDLEKLKPTYVAEMNNAFAAAQDFETKRLEFFKDILAKLTENLQLSKSDSAQEIYRTCREYIANANPKTDIEWWAENHGPGMNLNSTSFQDFIPEILETIGRGRMRLNQAVIVPNVENPAECFVQAEIVDKTTPQGQVNAIYSAVDNNRKKSLADDISEFDEESTTYCNNVDAADAARRSSEDAQDYGGVYSTLNEAHVYSNEVQTEDGYVEPASGSKVEAIYDYEGRNGNELSFGKGDIFEQLKGDDKGWATGRKNGKVGLFPSEYVRSCR